jgi:hypothetical protein
VIKQSLRNKMILTLRMSVLWMNGHLELNEQLEFKHLGHIAYFSPSK